MQMTVNGAKIDITLNINEHGDVGILANGKEIGSVCADGSCGMYPDPKTDFGLFNTSDSWE